MATNLAHLHPGQFGLIKSVDVDQSLTQRLYAMGFRVGKKIEIIRQASFHGPLHLRIGTTDLMMRISDAQHIKVSPLV